MKKYDYFFVCLSGNSHKGPIWSVPKTSLIQYSRILQFLCSSSFNYFYLGLTLAPLPSLSMYWIPKAGWDAQRNNEIKKWVIL